MFCRADLMYVKCRTEVHLTSPWQAYVCVCVSMDTHERGTSQHKEMSSLDVGRVESGESPARGSLRVCCPNQLKTNNIPQMSLCWFAFSPTSWNIIIIFYYFIVLDIVKDNKIGNQGVSIFFVFLSFYIKGVGAQWCHRFPVFQKNSVHCWNVWVLAASPLKEMMSSSLDVFVLSHALSK